MCVNLNEEKSSHYFFYNVFDLISKKIWHFRVWAFQQGYQIVKVILKKSVYAL